MSYPDAHASDAAGPVPRLASALAERYRIERELGAGGMATVYLAEDLKHHRHVAIKVLHAELSAMLGPERFLKEIELTANLQHPHILPLFDSGSADGLLYYVMPFVEGETLRARLERETQLPVDDALLIAREAADALSYAHGKGVVHRDIKPENILLQNGHALVADFGIALAVEQAGGARMTQTGLSLGTPQYMAPEQAMGERSVDARADIYALGAVTYEMLAGEPPFTGPNAQAVLARVITERPRPLGELRETVPRAVEDAVHAALAKLPADRPSTAARFAAALAAPSEQRADERRARTTTASSASPHTWRTWSVVGVAVAALALGAIADRLLHRPAPAATPPAARFSVMPDSGSTLGRFAIASDGSAIAFWALRGDSAAELFVRDMHALEARRVMALRRDEDPDSWGDVFFSPDARWIGFTAGGAIEKVPATGGATVMVARVPDASGGAAWGSDGAIYYADRAGTLMRVPPDGRAPELLLAPSEGRRFLEPRRLPGGGGLLLTVANFATGKLAWTVLNLHTGQIGKSYPGALAMYVDPGEIIYSDETGRLFRQAFDLGRLAPDGEPHALEESTAYDPQSSLPAYAVSRSGTLVFTPGALRTRHLMLLNRDGSGKALQASAFPWAPRLSPDGRRLAFGTAARPNDVIDVWVMNLAAGTAQRITTDSADNDDPQWSPDGRSLVYSSSRDSSLKDLYVRSADGSGGARLLLRRAGSQWSSDWSSDGRWILFTNVAPDGDNDIWMVPAEGGDARPWLASPFTERGGRFSPDGRWVAYSSTETGYPEVYIQSFPTPGARRIVSTNGGYNPIWRGDGRELYYWSGTRLVAAQLGWDADGPHVTGRVTLFDRPYVRGPHANFDAMLDGKHFIVVVGNEPENRMVVQLNAFYGAPQGE